VWFTDLKFLNVNAIQMIGTSNPPHKLIFQIGSSLCLLKTKLKQEFIAKITINCIESFVALATHARGVAGGGLRIRWEDRNSEDG